MKYSTIVADPPWPGKTPAGWHTLAQHVDVPYRTMSVEDIAAMPIRDLAAGDSHCYLWTTNGFLRDGFYVLERWGYRYVTCLVWAKTPWGIGPGGYYANTTEYVLFGKKGNLKGMRREPTTWFNWPRIRKHSAKPQEFFDLVEEISPGPRVELFARMARPGWDSWGDQAPLSIEWAI